MKELITFKWKECQTHRYKRMLKSGTCYQVPALWPGYMWNRDISPPYVHAFFFKKNLTNMYMHLIHMGELIES